MKELISLEEARQLVLSHVQPLPVDAVPVLEAVGRVAAADLTSDIDISPFAHSAMDGFAVRCAELSAVCPEAPVEMDVIAEVAAGDVYEGAIGKGQCVRIMTGAPLPDAADAVVMYEVVQVIAGGGKPGGRVAFTAPVSGRSNVRAAGEEAKAGEIIVRKGEVISAAGVGFLAGCGVVEVPMCRRPRVAIISIGSELVDPTEVPPKGKIRNSNSYALAACAQAAGAQPHILPIVKDTQEALVAAVTAAAKEYDCVVTSGGASNGDFDFIKPVVAACGQLLMTTVNIRPGKAQTFGIVQGTPVFGLPGNPAAAYVGFELIVRLALRKMQGYTHFDRPVITAKLSRDYRKKDMRRIFLRSTLCKSEDGGYVVTPAKNQSSGLFSTIQRSNCLAIVPEGPESQVAGSPLACMLLDVSEEVSL